MLVMPARSVGSARLRRLGSLAFWKMSDVSTCIRVFRDNVAYWAKPPARVPFVWLAAQLADRSLVTIDQPSTSERGVLRMTCLISHVRPTAPASPPQRAGLDPHPLSFQVAGWRARSLHVQVDAPPGLEILRATMRGFDETADMRAGENAPTPVFSETTVSSLRGVGVPPGPAPPAVDLGELIARPRVLAARGRRTHFYKHEPEQGMAVRLDIQFRVARFGFVSAAAWITAVMAGLLILTTLFVGSMEHHAEAAGPLLLVLPAVGAALVIQADIHALTSLMLTTVRRAVYLGSATSIAACVLLLIEGSLLKNGSWILVRIPWIVLSTIMVQVAMLAYLARVLPADSDSVRSTHRLMRKLTWPLIWALAWPNIRPLECPNPGPAAPHQARVAAVGVVDEDGNR